ncbi:ureidoglycolate lyase [Neorhizobium galegae]|uniref:ureidoglycolate lyase n=1 Tax=Neorhizobium galegae TaxID=399 RepID=UPI000621FB0C|nr:ureidoglycolate lyase [Neorhizobium galegae]CDZ64928.1 Ureidoglycolate lyase [Neorhizobium galegae bv. orientalis]KAB1119648.1 ureidoglycolate hydrolase [Neorhizobium galegae]MCQ1575297.1 ureidoglycolate lyase [Neorhizobium galegae]MCQ1810890.1 ureidoglycolate lyase [Neorhizobium galegae]MCQ1838424.1 ureidoglycolate lyase [Neorhizobium galegae]
MRSLLTAPLTAEAFRPFGTVCDVSDLSGLLPLPSAYEAIGAAVKPVLQVVKVESVPRQLTITRLEKHPYSAQTFLPLNMSPSLIVVCETGADGEPNLTTLKAFVAQPTQIVTYNRGVLHHRLTPLKASADFAMTMMSSADGDTVLYDLSTPITVSNAPWISD